MFRVCRLVVPRLMAACKQYQTGVGLLEVLVSLVLLSIGFLASAQMQLQSMRFTQSAHYRSQAHFLATDMIDRMRRNSAGVEANLYAGKSMGSAHAEQDCVNNSCTPAQLVAMDMFEWSDSLYNLRSRSNFISALPKAEDGTNAVATISMRADGVYTIDVTWKEFIDGAEQDSNLSIDFQPQ